MIENEISKIAEESSTTVNHPQSEKTDKEKIWLLWATLLLGILFSYFFYKKPIGISYPLFILLFYGVFLWFLHRRISFQYCFGWFLSLPVLLLAFTYFFFSNQLLMGLNFVMIPILMIAQTILLTNENRYHWFDFRFLMDLLYGLFVRLFVRVPKFFSTFSDWINPKGKLERSNVVIKILVGWLISLPLLALVLLLLTSADVVFSHYIDKLFQWIKGLNLEDMLWQLLLIIVVGMFLFSFLDTLIRSPKNTEGQVPKLQKKSRMDEVIMITVLCLMILIYIAFIIIQFRYMFRGSIDKVLPVKYTYAEYARKGFFELVAVTLINFSILLSGLVFLPKGNNGLGIFIRILQSLLVLSTMVILTSAFMRMSLYESQYGYTYLRVFTHAFMIFLFVLFMVALIKIWHHGVGLFQSYVVISLVAYLIINYINIDVFITKKNLERFDNTGLLDVKYLTNLSYDSLPIVLHYHLMKDLPRGFHSLQVHQQLLVSEYFNDDKSDFLSLEEPNNVYYGYYRNVPIRYKPLRYLTAKEIINKFVPTYWPSFNLSGYKAAKAVMEKLNITEKQYRKLLEK